MLRQRLWMIPVFQWIGYIGAIAGIYLLATGAASPWWLLAWAAGHVLGGLAISVALHRYFCHAAFTTTRFWHWAMALASCIVVQGSPLAWCVAHQTHHARRDTPGDPHDVALSYLFWKRYHDVPMVQWRLRQAISDPVLQFVHRNTLAVILAWVILLASISPWALLFGYLAPLGTVQLVGAVHQLVSHIGGEPRDLPLLEWVFPAAGEWNHRFHHDNARAAQLGTSWWHLDYGWAFIKAIRTD